MTGRKRENSIARVMILAGLLLFAAFIAVPLLWMLTASFRTPMEAFKWPPRIFPTTFDLRSYQIVFEKVDIGKSVSYTHLDVYKRQPFRPRELMARIAAALRRRGRAASAFEVGGLRVDLASGLVTRNGEEVFLSALEYRLLLVLLNNPKGVVTRARLLDELWDAAGEFVNDNTLTVYIKRLREKIEEDPANPKIILTVRGMGYRLGGDHVSQ